MKKFSFILIASYVISTISEINCETNTTQQVCGNELKSCGKDDDCCSHNCQDVYGNTTKMCFPPKPDDENSGTDVYDVCYYMKPENETISDNEYNKYGYNAAHVYMKSGDRLNVTYNGKLIMVQINDLTSHGNALELSREAAEALNITGIANCTIRDAEYEPEQEFDVLIVAQVLAVTLTLFGIISAF